MKIKKYILALLLLAILVNEQVLQWAVAVKVGGYAVSTGFQDAFKDFTVVGYLFFTAFRLVPYVGLGFALVLISRSRLRDYVLPVFAGGVVGILATIVWGSWMDLRPIYAGWHVSSTTAIAFIFIPLYAVLSGAIAALVAAAIYTPLRSRFRQQNT
jgi:hypothetical protein